MAKSKSLLIVTGDKELDANLRALAGATATRISNSAMRAGLKVILKAEEALVPRRTGALYLALGLRMIKRSRGFGGKVGINVGKQRATTFRNMGPSSTKENAGGVTAARHGPLVALGSRGVRTRLRIGGKFAYLEPHPRSRSTGKMPANPFIKRAAVSAENTVKLVMRTAIKKGIAAEAKRWTKKHFAPHPGLTT